MHRLLPPAARRLSILAAVFVAPCFAASYDVPLLASVTDQGDPAQTGSLAWYFAKGTGHTFTLTSTGNYYTARTLTLQANCTLTVAPGVTATIKAGGNASSPVYNKALLALQTGTTVRGYGADWDTLVIDANVRALYGIYAKNTVNTTIKDCTVRNTLNTYPAQTPGPHSQDLITGKSSTNLSVYHCLLRNAGYPALDFGAYESTARGIDLDQSTDGQVVYCDIAYTLGASVSIAGAVTTEIGHNVFQYSGLCSGLYGKPYSQDSIIGYHNSTPAGTDKAMYIRYNTIRHWSNHGIHVSGRGYHIDYNTINTGYGPSAGWAIFLGDQKPAPECSGNSTITNNAVGLGTGGSPYTIVIGPYKPGTITVSGNTGTVSVDWRYGTCSY